MSGTLIRTRSPWLALLAGFAALNAWALAAVGWDGVVRYFTTMEPISVVAAVDLVLALLIGIVLISENARQRSIRSAPYIILTVLTGSLGLIVYLAHHGVVDRDHPSESSTHSQAEVAARPGSIR